MLQADGQFHSAACGGLKGENQTLWTRFRGLFEGLYMFVRQDLISQVLIVAT